MRKLTIYGLVAVMTLALVFGAGISAPATLKSAEANPGTNWNASYYNNKDLSGNPVLTRVDPQINFNWASGSPDPAVNADNFSVRWTQTVNFPAAGRWYFRAGADDGIRMWIDNTLIIDQWHDATGGFTNYEVSLNQLTAGNHALKVEYYEATGLAGVQVLWWPEGGSPATAGTTSTSTGTAGSATTTDKIGGAATWNAFYFNNKDLVSPAVVNRTDTKIDFNWGTGSPDPAVPADNFSARWLTTVNFPYPGHWRFTVSVDDGARLAIDEKLFIDEWHSSTTGVATYEADVNQLTVGPHNLAVEYFEATGDASISVSWEYLGDATGAGGVTALTHPVYAAVTADNLNVRTGPGQGYPVIAQIVYPDNYVVTGAVGDMSWVQIQLDDGRTGWVSNEWVYLFSKEENFVDKIPRVNISVAPPAPVPASVVEATQLQGQTLAVVNMRDGASAYAKKIGAIPLNASVTVEARNGNGAWYLVSYQGIRGWVSAIYVDLLDGEVRDLVVSSEVVPVPPPGSVFVPEDNTGQPAVTVRGRAYTNLKFRDAASLRGNEIGSIPQNAEFVIEGRNTNGAWYLLTYDGQSGWVNAAYVQLIEGKVTDLPIR